MSSKKHLVFSTLTAANTYTGYKPGGGDLPLVAWEVTINGGANVAHRKTIQTPRGVGTSVTNEELELLQGDPTFKLHVKNGFITIDTAKDARDGDIAAENMQGRDASAPDVLQDYEPGKEPTVNATVTTETKTPTTSRRVRK